MILKILMACCLTNCFLPVSSGLLTIGAICSAVFRKNGSYTCFDSHSHEKNGLSSSDDASFLITFFNPSGLLTIGAIWFAVFRKNGSYTCFDSHSHEKNGLSSSDGAFCLISFFNLDGLVSYLYAFHDSMQLDTTHTNTLTHTNLQFDFLPINVKKSEEKQSYKDQMESPLEACLNDQKLGQANKEI